MIANIPLLDGACLTTVQCKKKIETLRNDWYKFITTPFPIGGEMGLCLRYWKKERVLNRKFVPTSLLVWKCPCFVWLQRLLQWTAGDGVLVRQSVSLDVGIWTFVAETVPDVPHDLKTLKKNGW